MLRHGSLRDDRRRRSLLEDAAVQDGGTSAKSRRAAKAAETYTELARSDFHARWSEFVPLGNWTVAGLLTAGLLAIGILEAGYYFALKSTIGMTGGLRAFDLARPDSLAGWCCTVVVLTSAVSASFIYSVRRYRLDDYRGRYRVWLGVAVLWTLMSIDGLADLRGAVRELAVTFSGYAGPGGGVFWWLAPWSLALAWFGLRMVVDARACRAATVSLVMGFTGLVAGFVLPQVSLPIAHELAVMLSAGCSLLGRWLLFFGQIAYARHVILEAHGRLPVRETKPKPEKKAEQKASEPAATDGKTAPQAKRRDDLVTRIDPPHTKQFQAATSGINLQRSPAQTVNAAKPTSVSPPSRMQNTAALAKPAIAPTKSTTQFIGGVDDEDSPPSHKLSRADRKRLRKQQRADQFDDE